MRLPFSRYTVSGHSMLPTLQPGQDVVVSNWAYLFSGPRAGDLVVFNNGGKAIVKRIQKRTDRTVFVCGDNEKDSTDSRQFGWILSSEIIGKVIWP